MRALSQKLLTAGLFATAVTLGSAANAMTIYDVTSTSKINCGTDPHGLWTNKYNNSGCNEYFDFQAGSTLTVDGAQARLQATAKNGNNDVATIDILFGGVQDTYSNPKTGGGPYNPLTDDPDWTFYTYIISGSIEFDPSGDKFYPLLVGQPGSGSASSGKPVLQIGQGADDKTPGFGASAWLDIYADPARSSAVYTGGNHWDLNMSLSLQPGPPNQVPAPATLGLLALGLLGLLAGRRRVPVRS